ncbi:MAG: aldo/keto reductase, partial [Anaerolineae bacterium]|nr:aldo/keto reductase [Anaerolineae bacterium]
NDTALADLIPYLQEKGVGIISASPLSMGLLTDRGGPDWHPANDTIKSVCQRAAEYVRQRGSEIAKVALQFSLSHPDIATTLIGTASPENIRKNVRWSEEPIDEGLLQEVQAILAPVHNQTWASGRPENN